MWCYEAGYATLSFSLRHTSLNKVLCCMRNVVGDLTWLAPTHKLRFQFWILQPLYRSICSPKWILTEQRALTLIPIKLHPRQLLLPAWTRINLLGYFPTATRKISAIAQKENSGILGTPIFMMKYYHKPLPNSHFPDLPYLTQISSSWRFNRLGASSKTQPQRNQEIHPFLSCNFC